MLELQNIGCTFPEFSLTDISFSVDEGEYFILLGESGSGKSLLLEAICGLNRINSGKLLLNGNDITNTKIQHRSIGLVFQDLAVFPHLTVKENIAFPLKTMKYAKNQKDKVISDICSILQISHLLKRKPETLSGGELQRVALARTLVQKPKVLLLDEPLSATDSKLRSELRALLRQINRMGQTIIHVTHDFDEAVSLADHIAILNQGRILQTGTPQDVFSNPINEFVAHFAGLRNFFKCSIAKYNSSLVAIPASGLNIYLDEAGDAETGYILIRNENILLSQEAFESSARNNFKGQVIDMYPSRSGMEVLIDIGIKLYAQISHESSAKLDISRGAIIWVHFKASSVKFIKS